MGLIGLIGLIVGGIVTGMLVAYILFIFLVDSPSTWLSYIAFIALIAGAGAIVYFGFIQQVMPMPFAISLMVGYLVSCFGGILYL
ncbi:MAG: hypothetical protein LBB61_01850 [Treponema sp.]|jgi:hypothetical protein|nr:hypothetical protein [Treponema sp.]